MAPEQFLPFLTDDQGRSLVEDGGVVVTRPIPEWQENSPEGWENNTIQYARNLEYWGIMKSYITDLKFFLKSAFILRDWFYRFGMEVVMLFIWLKLDQNFGGGLEHKGWYKGEIDFSTFKDTYDGVEVNITEGGFHKDLTANKNIPYEYVVADDPDAVSVEIDGMEIQQRANYLVSNGNVLVNNGQHTVDLTLLSSERTGEIFAESQERRHFLNNTDLRTNSVPFYTTGNNVSTIRITANFGVTPTLADGVGINVQAGSWLLIRAFDENDVATGIPLYHWGNTGSVLGFYNVHRQVILDTTIVVPANHRLFLCMFLTIGGVIASGSGADEQVFWQYDNAETDFFKTSYLFRYRETISNAYRVYDVGNKLTMSMSNNVSSLDSPLLQNDDNLLCISGDCIRNIPGAKFKSDFNDYYKSVDAVKCVSMAIRDNLPVIQSRYSSFNNTSIANLGECREFMLEPATEMIYTSVESGYLPVDIEDVNGRYAFCTPWVWKSPVKRIKDVVYDCRSVYKADPFEIEIYRINLDGKNTTDGQTDNNIFFLDAEKAINDYTGALVITENVPAGGGYIRLTGVIGLNLKPGMRFKLAAGLNAGNPIFTIVSVEEVAGDTKIFVNEVIVDENITTTIEFRHYKLRRLPYTTITGVPSPSTVYNIELSQKRNLANHYRWLRSAWDHMDNKFMTFQTTEKNADLETTDVNGNKVTEKANVLIGDMGDKVFLPYYVNMEVESPFNLRELMVANSDGYFDFANNTLGMKGYPFDIKTNDATLETQEYKLLLTPDNDLIQLTKNR